MLKLDLYKTIPVQMIIELKSLSNQIMSGTKCRGLFLNNHLASSIALSFVLICPMHECICVISCEQPNRFCLFLDTLNCLACIGFVSFNST